VSKRAALYMSDAFQRIFGAEGLRDKAFLARWKKYPREYLAAYRELEADWVRRVGQDAARKAPEPPLSLFFLFPEPRGLLNENTLSQTLCGAPRKGCSER
jgi:hypothetical protein